VSTRKVSEHLHKRRTANIVYTNTLPDTGQNHSNATFVLSLDLMLTAGLALVRIDALELSDRSLAPFEVNYYLYFGQETIILYILAKLYTLAVA
jgi:LPXTG-motif cell wall-anchored protein